MASSPLRRTPRADEARRDGARCVALLQEHRGHGVSTAAYYLGRVLVEEGLRVLLVDLTGRRAHLQSLLARRPMRNLALWSPSLAQPADLPALLAQARAQTLGRVDVLLLDADASLLEHAGGLAAGIDYALVVTAPTAEGQAAADRIAGRLGDAPPPYGKVGVAFSRVGASQAGGFPEQTDGRKLPIIGHYPADYLLAAGDEYSLKGGDPSWPHDKYLYAILRLGRILVRQAALRRAAPSTVAAATAPQGPSAAGKSAAETSAVRQAMIGEEAARGAEPRLGA